MNGQGVKRIGLRGYSLGKTQAIDTYVTEQNATTVMCKRDEWNAKIGKLSLHQKRTIQGKIYNEL